MMVIKIKDPRRWMMLPAGEVISLEGTGRRPVRLEVNAVTDAHFQIAYPDETVAFLAAVKGIETIEFVADGPVEVWVTSEAEVYFYTDEGRNVAFVNDGKTVFTKPHVRREGSERIIYMQELMLANERRMNAKLAAAVAAYEAREAEGANSGGTGEVAVPPASGEPPLEQSSDAGATGVAGDGEAGGATSGDAAG